MLCVGKGVCLHVSLVCEQVSTRPARHVLNGQVQDAPVIIGVYVCVSQSVNLCARLVMYGHLFFVRGERCLGISLVLLYQSPTLHSFHQLCSINVINQSINQSLNWEGTSIRESISGGIT